MLGGTKTVAAAFRRQIQKLMSLLGAVAFKSEFQNLALLVAFRGRGVSMSFAYNVIFKDNGKPNVLMPKGLSLLPVHLKLSNYV